MDGELLDVKQVQAYLKVSERTVFNLISRGELKGFKAGRSWRFRITDVQDYENSQRLKAEGGTGEVRTIERKEEEPAA